MSENCTFKVGLKSIENERLRLRKRWFSIIAKNTTEKCSIRGAFCGVVVAKLLILLLLLVKSVNSCSKRNHNTKSQRACMQVGACGTYRMERSARFADPGSSSASSSDDEDGERKKKRKFARLRMEKAEVRGLTHKSEFAPHDARIGPHRAIRDKMASLLSLLQKRDRSWANCVAGLIVSEKAKSAARKHGKTDENTYDPLIVHRNGNACKVRGYAKVAGVSYLSSWVGRDSREYQLQRACRLVLKGNLLSFASVCLGCVYSSSNTIWPRSGTGTSGFYGVLWERCACCAGKKCDGKARIRPLSWETLTKNTEFAGKRGSDDEADFARRFLEAMCALGQVDNRWYLVPSVDGALEVVGSGEFPRFYTQYCTQLPDGRWSDAATVVDSGTRAGGSPNTSASSTSPTLSTGVDARSAGQSPTVTGSAASTNFAAGGLNKAWVEVQMPEKGGRFVGYLTKVG